MDDRTCAVLPRRGFLREIVSGATAAALALPGRSAGASDTRPELLAGEGVVDTTPPVGIELAGLDQQ